MTCKLRDQHERKQSETKDFCRFLSQSLMLCDVLCNLFSSSRFVQLEQFKAQLNEKTPQGIDASAAFGMISSGV